MKLKKIKLLALSLLVASSFSACSKADKNNQEKKTLSIKGSDTMVHLASTWAEKYMSAHPGMQISVTGGGSGTGIAALLNGTTDLCAASRKIKKKEIKIASEKGILPVEHVVGLDGIAVIINPANPINELTLEQLRLIFTGQLENWEKVGGKKENVLILSRESNSGTYVFFQKKVLNKEDYSPKARLMPASSSVVQTVSADVNSIGYVGLAYALEAGDKVKILNVKNDDNSPAIAPSQSTVKDGSYSVARPLHFYTKGDPQGLIKSFLDFTLSTTGQAIVKEVGYVPSI